MFCSSARIIYSGKQVVGFTAASWKVRIFSCAIFHETEWLLKKEKNWNLKMSVEKHGEKEKKKDVKGVHRSSLTRKK